MRQACLHIAVLLLALTAAAPATAQEKAHGRLFVETNIEQAVISILNHELTFMQGMPLSPGMYVVQVAAEGFPTKTKTVKITAGEDVRLRVSLERESADQKPAEAAAQSGPWVEERGKGRGRLFVKPTPEDATVRILNIGPKFKQGIELKPGTYEIEVKKDGVGEMVRSVEMRKNEDLTLTVNLQADDDAEVQASEPAPEPDAEPGRLYVTTSPSDARVRLPEVDTKFAQGVRLPPGEYGIEVSREGYQKTTLLAEVYAGKDTRVSITLIPDNPVPDDFPPAELEDGQTVTMAAKKAKERLYVVAMPEDAGIRILNIVPKFEQGIEVGDGEYEVEVSHDDYETQVRMITVPKDKHLAVGFDLRPPEERMREEAQAEAPAETPTLSDPAKGQLFVETDVEGAQVKLMDLNQPFVQGIELAPGSYRIEVFKEGVGRKEAMAVVSSGKASHVKVSLVPPPLPPEEAMREEVAERRQALLEKALQAERDKKPEEALALVNQALELDPLHARSYTMRGNLRFAIGDYEKALEDYDKAVELGPNSPVAWLARGKVHALLDDPESACYDFWKACALERCEGIAAARREGLCR